jgi:branched-chain amino acid aminotransferase
MIRIASEAEVLSYFRTAYSNRRHRYFGFYNSHANTIITDEALMLLPVDDRGATRAHGVFDVLYLKNYKLINLQQHVNRLAKSAESASIIPPFSEERMR